MTLTHCVGSITLSTHQLQSLGGRSSVPCLGLKEGTSTLETFNSQLLPMAKTGINSLVGSNTTSNP